ncbi:hypothetical protein THRCLA_23117 [Thraustotheca clavata]|uniref:Uncharacterized protein n=1 Tax=Thraustotheca clavata TaxID=74557 RepID=A0A1V9YDY0_9STRA|nr:hypothetical protein THRCLA_23117 [Thraustotheca clavata]
MSGKSQPTSKPSDTPKNDCNGCSRCFYPAANQCLSADYDKEYCQYLTSSFEEQLHGKEL